MIKNVPKDKQNKFYKVIFCNLGKVSLWRSIIKLSFWELRCKFQFSFFEEKGRGKPTELLYPLQNAFCEGETNWPADKMLLCALFLFFPIPYRIVLQGKTASCLLNWFLLRSLKGYLFLKLGLDSENDQIFLNVALLWCHTLQ